MSALMTLPRSSRGTGMPSTVPYVPASLATASTAHRRHVGGQVVALHDDVAQPAATGQELDEPGAGVLVLSAPHAPQLEVVVLEEADGVVSALAVMHAARVDAEAQARVDVDALLQLGHADHDVIDAGQHELLVIRRRVAEPCALRLVVVDPQLRLA